jgi:hypothetical protein
MALPIGDIGLVELDPLIRVAVILGLLAGLFFIYVGTFTQGILGVILIILSLVALLAVVHNGLSK